MMTPFMKWHKGLRHSPVFTEVWRLGPGGEKLRQFFAGEVDNAEAFWNAFVQAAEGALVLPEFGDLRMHFAVYRMSAAGYERPVSRDDIKKLAEHRREATMYSDLLRAGEFTIRI